MTNENTDVISIHDWLVRAKFRVPNQRVSLVERIRLTSRLDDALGLALIVVAAPAGFGKTTLLCQWREAILQRGCTVAWVTLDEADSDPGQFVAYMAFAFGDAGVDMGSLEIVAEQGASDTKPLQFLISMFDQISRHTGQIVLMLDDYHRLNSTEIDVLIEHIVRDGPQNLTLVLCSRARPGISLEQYLAAGQACEIDADMLRMSQDETVAVLDMALDQESVDALFQSTEGWAIAIQLARLVMLDGQDSPNVIEKFEGREGHIAHYLTDQIVDKLPSSVQDFLIKTSILERFNASLADALIDYKGSWKIIRQLEPLKAFLVPLEHPSDWYRYHHLFAECLQSLLMQRYSQQDVTQLHLKASAWLEHERYIGDAVRHAKLAGDLDRCAELIEHAGGWELILFGGIGYLRNLLRAIPEHELGRFPRIQAAKAYVALKDGQLSLARAYHDAACGGTPYRDIEEIDRPGLGRDLLNIKVLLYAYEDQFSDPKLEPLLMEWLQGIAPDDGISSGVILCQMLLLCLANGRFVRADSLCRDAMRAMRMSNTVLGLNYCYLHSGLSAFYQGKFQLAQASFWEAQCMAEDNFGADSGLKALATILVSYHQFWSGKDASEEDRLVYYEAVKHAVEYDSWCDILIVALEQIVHAYPGDVGRMLKRFGAIAEERALGRLQACVDAYDLKYSLGSDNQAYQSKLANSLELDFPLGVWRRDNYCWRQYQAVGSALAWYYSRTDRSRAIKVASDLVECCEYFGAQFHLIWALILKATLYDRSGDRKRSTETLLLAFEKAAPEKILRPFLLEPMSWALVRAVQKYARSQAVDSLTTSFISLCLESISSGANDLLSADHPFSRRELEVLSELSHNLSNKEIARAMDMTEHTVKFHLKNIFRKLNVEKRDEAVNVAQIRNYIA